jgi:ferredoxin
MLQYSLFRVRGRAGVGALCAGAIATISRRRFSRRNGLFVASVTQGETAMAGRLKVRVDQDKCQGHSRCKSLAPELFELDEFGNAHEIGDGSVPSGLEQKAWLARANCPEIAVEVTED